VLFTHSLLNIGAIFPDNNVCQHIFKPHVRRRG
jgi:hypothetical protein